MINEGIIAKTFNTYNQTGGMPQFTLLDVLVLDSVISNTYTTDLQLSIWFMCSERTIKRSINKLCNFGFVTKHLAHDNTKSLELNQDTLDAFLRTWSNGN